MDHKLDMNNSTQLSGENYTDYDKYRTFSTAGIVVIAVKRRRFEWIGEFILFIWRQQLVHNNLNGAA